MGQEPTIKPERMTVEPSPEEKQKLVGLSEALRALSDNEEDHRIAAWLDEVVDRVNRLAEAPTREQMASALGLAEMGVHNRLDQILMQTNELRDRGNKRDLALANLADTIDSLALGLPELTKLINKAVDQTESLLDRIENAEERIGNNESRLNNQSRLVDKHERFFQDLAQKGQSDVGT